MIFKNMHYDFWVIETPATVLNHKCLQKIHSLMDTDFV